MRNSKISIVLILTSLFMVAGCANKKARMFGEDMPTMQEIHAEKFGTSPDDSMTKPTRSADESTSSVQSEFHWLPNPTLHMYVFKHLTATGLPVPGYTTFFKMHKQDVIAEPGERGGWE